MKLLCLIIFLSGWSVAFADGAVSIKQLQLAKNRAILEFSGSLKEGSEWVATFSDGKQCSIKIISIQNSLAAADTTMCGAAANLIVGQKLEPALMADVPVPAPVAAPINQPPLPPPPVAKRPYVDPDRIHGSVYLLLNSAHQIKFSSVSGVISGVRSTGNATFDLETADGIGAECWHTDEQSWGWSAGLTLEPKRDFKSADFKISTGSFHTDYVGSKPSFSMDTIYWNAIYRWDKAYAPMGINFSFPTFTEPTGSTETASISGGLGVQFGFGYHAADHFSLEAMYRIIIVKATLSDPTIPSYFDLGTGAMSGLNINLKGDF